MGMPSGIIGLSVYRCHTGWCHGTIAHLAFPEQASSVGFYAILGMGAMMGALLQAPLAAITAVVELTRSPDIILPTMLIVVCASNFTAHRQRSVSLLNLKIRAWI